MTLAPRTKVELGAAAAVVLVGAVFALEGLRIDPRSYEAVGPRFVPVLLACTMIALGALLAVSALRRDAAAPPPGPGFGFADSDLARVAAVVGAGAGYVLAFWALGYMVATMIGLALTLRAFGVRALPVLIGVPIAAGIVYQIVFMGLMGLLDPKGALLDLRPLARLVTPG